MDNKNHKDQSVPVTTLYFNQAAAQLLEQAQAAESKLNLQDAYRLCEEALNLYEQINDQKAVASMYNKLGNLAASMEHEYQALDMYTKALAISQQIGELHTAAESMLGMARMEQWLCDDDDQYVEELLLNAAQNFEEVGSLQEAANCIDGLIARADARKDVSAGESLRFKLLDLLEQMEDWTSLNQCKRGIALFLRRIGRHADAMSMLDQAISNCINHGDTSMAAFLKEGQSMLEERSGNLPAAQQRLQEALDLYASDSSMGEMAVIKRKMGCLAIKANDWQKAERMLSESKALFRHIGNELEAIFSTFVQATIPALKCADSKIPEHLSRAFFICTDEFLPMLPEPAIQWHLNGFTVKGERLTILNVYNEKEFVLFPSAVLVTVFEDGADVARQQLRAIGMSDEIVEQILITTSRHVRSGMWA